MNIFESIILGLVQGASEFLPISSTGHLTLTGRLLNLINESHPEQWTAYIAVIQLGTLVAVLVYFFSDLVSITKSFVSESLIQRKKYSLQSIESKLGWMIIAGTVPIVTIGLALKKVIEGNITKNLFVISISLIVLAIILLIAERTAKFKKDIKDMTIKDAVIIGVAQCFALFPGASRSGTTLTGGLFCGLKRESAARFSFLLSIPAVLASGVLELKESMKFMNHDLMVNMIVSTIIAAVSGYFAIDFLLKYLKKNSTILFIIYRVILGVVILILLNYQFIKA